VKEEGLDALNFRSLGARPELDITGTAPLYYFGSKVGLLGAVAEQGFGEVAARLRDVRSKATPGMDAIVSVSIAYAQFGLENPRLYQAIHTAELWHSAVADTGASKRDWVKAARDARDRAFVEFRRAVSEAQNAGALNRTPTDVAAQAMTALVDGYLFQALEENVDADHTLEKRLEYVARLVAVILNGLAGPNALIPE
jgi:AcrR family transcriptional regulator